MRREMFTQVLFHAVAALLFCNTCTFFTYIVSTHYKYDTIMWCTPLYQVGT